MKGLTVFYRSSDLAMVKAREEGREDESATSRMTGSGGD